MKILITFNPDIEPNFYKETLEKMGMIIDSIFPFGVISGSVDLDKIDEISNLGGVLAVEEDIEATITE